MRTFQSFFLASLFAIHPNTAVLAYCSEIDLQNFKAAKEDCVRGCAFVNGVRDTECESEKCSDYNLGRPKDCPPETPQPQPQPQAAPPHVPEATELLEEEIYDGDSYEDNQSDILQY